MSSRTEARQFRVPEPELMDDPGVAQAYAAADFGGVNQAFAERLLELAGTSEEVRLVDLGCGPADIPIRLAKLRPNWQIVAVDASAAMLGLARSAVAAAEFTASISLVQADAKATGLSGGAFDVVCSNSILHHVASPTALWAEMRRLLRPGGLLFLRDLARPATLVNARQIVAQYAAQESLILQTEFFNSLCAAYTPEEVRSQLASLGLDHLTVMKVTDRHLDVFGRVP